MRRLVIVLTLLSVAAGCGNKILGIGRDQNVNHSIQRGVEDIEPD
ncbi:MAG: hypothetical protein ACM3OC_04660 [Deltaproteobacteria bacterium]